MSGNGPAVAAAKGPAIQGGSDHSMRHVPARSALRTSTAFAAWPPYGIPRAPITRTAATGWRGTAQRRSRTAVSRLFTMSDTPFFPP
ncbi:hypothetical protein ACFS5L_44910 [Streptomyces phyllanthi]|uniref:hypothetical protein n=1 Tax=Streptomyces phyllanthi TaxID=1803180 RepID=UPI00128E191D|nr:hypothetical protein [Streptomyces phyllanthi]